ncbi:MAG: peptidylprolyl isomerase [Pseudomonadota bacterium]
MRQLWAIIGCVAAGCVIATSASAQMIGNAVAATVNDNPISTFDVQQRMRLMMVTTGGRQLTPEAEAQLQEQALKDLVDEELKRQETTEFDVNVSEDEVNEELARIAGSGGTTIDGLTLDLAQQGIAIETLRAKIRTDQAWERLVRGRFNSRVNVTEGEIDNMLDKMRSEAEDEQFYLSEICLPVDDEQQRDRIYNIGMQMIGQMRQGVPFQALAQQFSICPSAARGGELGWMRPGELEPTVASIVTELSEGNVSTPIDMDDMMKVVAVQGKRAAAERGDPSYELAYAGVSKRDLSRTEAEEATGQLPLANPCNGGELSTDLGQGIGVELLPMVPINAIRPAFHNDLLDLQRGDLSPLLESSDAYHRIYVCEMDEGLGLPRRRVIANRLENDEFQLLSRRYLRDLERDSDVEIRLGQETQDS